MRKRDPGPCGICGAAHSTCTGSRLTGQLAIPQTPMRDAMHSAELQPPPLVAEAATSRLEAEAIQDTLPAGQFTSGTYRRKRRR